MNGKTTTSGAASGLTNGVAYAVAVAATDGVENVGLLSQVVCGTPAPVDGFFDEYRKAGGQGGGGFCGVAQGSTPGAAWALLAAAGAMCIRRRRRAK